MRRGVAAVVARAREAVTAVEIAAYAGDATHQAAERCVVGNRLVGLLTGSIR